MTASEFKRWLAKSGCWFETDRGKGGHITVHRGNRFTTLPIHGKKDLPDWLVRAIKKQLELK